MRDKVKLQIMVFPDPKIETPPRGRHRTDDILIGGAIVVSNPHIETPPRGKRWADDTIAGGVIGKYSFLSRHCQANTFLSAVSQCVA